MSDHVSPNFRTYGGGGERGRTGGGKKHVIAAGKGHKCSRVPSRDDQSAAACRPDMLSLRIAPPTFADVRLIPRRPKIAAPPVESIRRIDMIARKPANFPHHRGFAPPSLPQISISGGYRSPGAKGEGRKSGCCPAETGLKIPRRFNSSKRSAFVSPHPRASN